MAVFATASSDMRLPAVLLFEEAKKQFPDLPEQWRSATIYELLNELQKRKLCPVFALDRADKIFPLKTESTSKMDSCERCHDQLYAIGETTGCFGVITGSAKRLKSLAYARKEDPAISDYKFFSSLNNTKYRDVTMRPMHEPLEIISFVQLLDPSIDVSDALALKLLAYFGGVHGHVTDWMCNPEDFTMPDLPDPFKSNHHRISWHVIANITSLNANLLSQVKDDDSFEWINNITGITEQQLLDSIEPSEALHESKQERHRQASAMLIQLIDEGSFIQKDDTLIYPTCSLLLLKYHRKMSAEEYGLTLYQTHCIIDPTGRKRAEELEWLLMEGKCKKWAANGAQRQFLEDLLHQEEEEEEEEDESDQDEDEDEEGEDEDGEGGGATTSFSIDQIVDTPFKVVIDTGIDMVVVRSAKQVDVYQIKLSNKSPIDDVKGEGGARYIVEGLNNVTAVKEILTSIGLDKKARITKFLMTTQHISKPARLVFKQSKVNIIEFDELRSLWPDRVRNFANKNRVQWITTNTVPSNDASMASQPSSPSSTLSSSASSGRVIIDI